MRTGKAQGIKTNCIRLWGTLMLLFMLGMMRLPVYGAEEFSVQELSGEGTVTSDSLNIRSGPGTEYDVVGKAAKGTVLVVTGQADNGWYRIELEGKNGYASGKYITFEAKADVSEQDPQEQTEQTSGTGMGYISQRYIDYLKTAGIIFGMVVVVIMIFITLKGIGKSRREDEEYDDEEYDEEEDDDEDDDGYDDEEYEQDEEEDEEPVRKPRKEPVRKSREEPVSKPKEKPDREAAVPRKEPKAPKASEPIKISEEDYQLHIDPIYFEEEKPLPQPDHVSPEDQNTKTQDLQKAMKKLGELQEEIERLKTEK